MGFKYLIYKTGTLNEIFDTTASIKYETLKLWIRFYILKVRIKKTIFIYILSYVPEIFTA